MFAAVFGNDTVIASGENLGPVTVSPVPAETGVEIMRRE